MPYSLKCTVCQKQTSVTYRYLKAGDEVKCEHCDNTIIIGDDVAWFPAAESETEKKQISREEMEKFLDKFVPIYMSNWGLLLLLMYSTIKLQTRWPVNSYDDLDIFPKVLIPLVIVLFISGVCLIKYIEKVAGPLRVIYGYRYKEYFTIRRALPAFAFLGLILLIEVISRLAKLL